MNHDQQVALTIIGSFVAIGAVLDWIFYAVAGTAIIVYLKKRFKKG